LRRRSSVFDRFVQLLQLAKDRSNLLGGHRVVLARDGIAAGAPGFVGSAFISRFYLVRH
jgi:hypothetical protein